MTKCDKYAWWGLVVVSFSGYAFTGEFKYLAILAISGLITLTLKLIINKLDAKELEQRDKRIEETAKLLRTQHEKQKQREKRTEEAA
jgi:hypothetical protein